MVARRTELLALADETVLGDVVDPLQPRVTADTDQEKTASIALHHKVAAVPVVDEANHLVGVVGSITLMDILRREHVKDLGWWSAWWKHARHIRRGAFRNDAGGKARDCFLRARAGVPCLRRRHGSSS